MWRKITKISCRTPNGSSNQFFSSQICNKKNELNSKVVLPANTDIVIIGGGSAGCNTLYQLAMRGVPAVLLESHRLTCGTTWHTAGLTRFLQPSDVDVTLLTKTVDIFRSLEQQTGIDPGYINNGGLYIAHNNEREKDYLRVSTLGKAFNVESEVIDSYAAAKVFSLLDPKTFQSALHCPGDGVVDPAMLCNALKKGATDKGAKVFEDTPVTGIKTEIKNGVNTVVGVTTPHGTINTKCVINCAGVWSRALAQGVDLDLPIVPMKHSYVVTNSMKGVRGAPNVRDQDTSIYLRIQGDAILLGGYESNPILLDDVPNDFHFGLYELDWSVFECHMKAAIDLVPSIANAGMKTTICGPESFTPDHKPIMGEDPRLSGLFHNCAFNSAGMMLGGGCAEQITEWVLYGRPSLPMQSFDIRRFTPKMIANRQWNIEKSHECYAKYYNTVFPMDESLGGRNLCQGILHKEMVEAGAFMEARQGWERPGYFLPNGSVIPVPPYDYYGQYNHTKNSSLYSDLLEEDCTFSYPKSFSIVHDEAIACRTNVVLFDLSYYCKMYLSGPDATEAVDWLFTANSNKDFNKLTYTCALNARGGVEADVTVTQLESVSFTPQEKGFYIVAGGASAYQTWTHILSNSQKKKFNVNLVDLSENVGILSIQGPNSMKVLQKLVESSEITKENLPIYTSKEIDIDGHKCLVMRVSFVGELGYELHIPAKSCQFIYKKLKDISVIYNMKLAGFRSLYSLSCEKGYHLWHVDLRSNDSPLEANLGFVCRKAGSDYLGKSAIDQQRREGIDKRIVYFTSEEKLPEPVWGLETIWRDGDLVGFIRRGDYAFDLNCNMAVGYVKHHKGEKVTNDYIKSGKYQLELMGKKYNFNAHLKSPFDPNNKRML